MSAPKGYEDIFGLSRPPSARPPMPMADRAAQFSPFAALTGHEDAVCEAGRFVEDRIALGDAEQAELDRQLAQIRATLSERPRIIATYFVADLLKEGGTYATCDVRVRAFDELTGALVFETGERISVADIFSLVIL